MVFIKNKRGQAAIEFLMTYGWMLLVVLIVGALIFSFVDFGSLLPNKVDLNNNLRGSATDSAAYEAGGEIDSSYSDANVVVVFTYNGAKRVEIGPEDAHIFPDSTSIPSCNSTVIMNSDTTTETDVSGDTVPFLNGQTGYFLFECTDLIKGDVLEGRVQIDVKSISTGLKIPSSGPLRLTIN